MKFSFCRKCKKETWLEKHHILPQSTFGKNEEVEELCSNCHREYHQKLGKEDIKNPDMIFHFNTFYKWFYDS